MTPDQDTVCAFVSALAGNEASTFQFFADRKDAPNASKLVRQVHGVLRTVWPTLLELNAAGAGTFITVNQTDGRGRSKENVTALRALFIDGDDMPLPAAWPVPPNILTMRDATHWHAFWKLTPGESLDRFSAAQKHLAKYFGTDPVIHDLPRVMRVAGTVHHKGAPTLVSMERCEKAPLHTIDEILAAHPVAPEAPEQVPPVMPPRASTARDVYDRARLYLAKVEPAVSGQHGSNQALRAARVLVHDFGLSIQEAEPLLQEYNSRCVPPWSDKELRHKLESAVAKSNSGDCETPKCGLRDVPTSNGNHSGVSNVSAPNTPSENAALLATLNPPQPFPILTCHELVEQNPARRPYVIQGLLRRGETMNLISGSKSNKTWTRDAGVLALATGGTWMGLECVQSNVLVIDNELHKEELSHRIRVVATAMQLPAESYEPYVGYAPLRGNLMDVDQIVAGLKRSERKFDVIILDALYRALGEKTDENSNSAMARVYNKIDLLAMNMDAAILIVHHSTKGSQGQKDVMSVGAGAGASGRAVDAHMIARAHKEADVSVFEAKPRSSPPIQPACFRWSFPLWTPAPECDPSDLEKRTPSRVKKEVAPQSVEPPKPEWNTELFVSKFVTATPKLRSQIEAEALKEIESQTRISKYVKHALDAELVYKWQDGHNTPIKLATIPQPDLLFTVDSVIDGIPVTSISKGNLVEHLYKLHPRVARPVIRQTIEALIQQFKIEEPAVPTEQTFDKFFVLFSDKTIKFRKREAGEQ